MNPSHSTPLENFTWQAGTLRLQTSGRTIDLSPERAAPALEAFQAFYEEALNAYGAGQRVAPPPVIVADPDRASIGGAWLNGIRRVFARVLSWATGRPIPDAAERPAPAADVRPAARPTPPPAPAKSPPGAPTLALRAVFADPQGVHVVWSHGGTSGKSRDTELLYSFDSAVAERLQGCYGALKTLGIDVVDLQVWRKTPEAETAAAAPSTGAPKPEPGGTVMRLLPGAADNPARALVTPVGDEKNIQVLSAPERLIAALHAAADPERPMAERLTHLRCTPAKGGLKVVAVGLGQEGDAPGKPARWENISPWFEAAKKATPTRTRAPEPTGAAVAVPAGTRPGPEPEFF